MHGLGVIDHGGDTLGLEGGLESIALGFAFEAEGVLRPTGVEACGNDRGLNAWHIFQKFGIAGGDTVDIGEFVVTEGAEFHLKDSSLNGVKAGVEANAYIVVLERTLAVNTVRLDSVAHSSLSVKTAPPSP